MSKAGGATAGPEKAHVTIDPGMGKLYTWFCAFDRRYRARELVILAREGLEARERQAAQPAGERLAAQAAATLVHEESTPAMREEPAGFLDLVDPSLH